MAGRHVDVFNEQGQRLPHTKRAFVKQPDQQAVTLIVAGIHQLTNLGLQDGLWLPLLWFLLLEQFFCNWLLSGNMVEKAFVSSSACMQIGGCFLCKTDLDIIDT